MIVAGSASPLLLASAGGYNLTKSLRFRSSASAYLNRTFSTPTLSTKWTWSGWFKLGFASTYYTIFDGGSPDTRFGRDPSTNQLYVNNDTTNYIITTPVYRDYSAWYHAVLAFDSSQGTASNRLRLYINGSEVTAFATDNRSSISGAIGINTATAHGIGRQPSGGSAYFDGYMAEINFVDGQQLTPSSFGETSTSTGVWIPKKYTGTYGTNGFYLPFTDTTSTSTLGTDFSGNSNTWTVNNISLTSGSTYDSMTDVPTLTSATTANYCVLNPLNASSVGTANNGNLQAYSTSGANTGAAGINGTIALPTTGLYYFEVTMSAVSNAGLAGIAKLGATQDTNFGAGAYANIYAYTNTTGVAYTNNTTAYTGSTLTTGDILGVAVDMTNGALYFAKNNTWQNSGVPTSGASKTGAISFTVTSDLLPTCYAWKNSGADALSVNFGQRPFAYTPPTGFVALNTFNLPTPTIGATASTTANKYFNANLYTGNAGSNTISGVGFQPDFIWAKSRSNGAAYHGLWDVVRGSNNLLYSNGTDAEANVSNLNMSPNADGFSINGGNSSFNLNTSSQVAWNWKANGSGSTNTAGSITSTVSANTTAGFSVATFTSPSSGTASFGHGLGVTPSFVIVKSRASGNWICQHTSTGTQYLLLNGTGAATTDSTVWNSAFTSTVVNIGTGFAGTVNYVAYCFSAVAGYSAFGSYTGNGSSDGPFIFTGFRPKFVMIKRSDSADDWIMMDSSRSTYNVAILTLYANGSYAEDSNVTNRAEDFLSNGFKIRSSPTYLNASGGTYIYMAFAESPFKYSLGR